MLGFLRPRGELVAIDGHTVVFLSAKPFRIEQKIDVRLGLAGNPGQIIAVALQVVSMRSGPDDLFVVVGVVDRTSNIKNMKGHELRAYGRTPHRIAIKSEDIPGYRAITKNLSRGGFKVELEGALKIGKQIKAHFEFDDPVGFSLDLKAQVVWSNWRSQKYYDTGFVFIEEPELLESLQELSRWLDEDGAKSSDVPFKPPQRGEKKVLARQQKRSQEPKPAPEKKVQQTIEARTNIDDDPTPLGLPTIVEPLVRELPLKLSVPLPVERPHPIRLPEGQPVAKISLESKKPDVPIDLEVSQKAEEISAQEAPLAMDQGVKVYFQATLRGWAWEGAEDTVVLVLEDSQGVDYWLEFPGCRRLGARCPKEPIGLGFLSIVQASTEVISNAGEAADSLWHYRFCDNEGRIAVELVAQGCQEQVR